MRKIKFRGKIEHTNEWVQGYYFETPLTDGKTDSMPEDGWYFLTGKKRHVISRNNCAYQVNPDLYGLSDKLAEYDPKQHAASNQFHSAIKNDSLLQDIVKNKFHPCHDIMYPIA